MVLTTAEAALIAEVIHDEIIEFKEPEAVGRRMFPVVARNEGDSIKIVKEGAWPRAQKVAEGAEAPLFQPSYTPTTKSYDKLAYRVGITHEMITDARWDLVKRSAQKAGMKIGLEETLDIINLAKSEAGIAFTVSGRWGGANADELGDISTCIGKLNGANYGATTLVVHPADYAHLAALDEFVHREKGGVGADKFYKGDVLGLEVLSTTQMSENNFLILDRNQAGVDYVREELRQEEQVVVERDLYDMVFYLRYKPAVLAPSAIVAATGYA